MPTTLTNGIQLPDKGSVDWYGSMQSNYNLIDTHLGNTDTHVTAEDKANWNSKQGSLSQAQLDAIAQVATNTDDIASLQSGKANASHTHSSSDITDIGDYATKQYVDTSISGLVDSAPNALDTLNELAAALNDDANFASTVTSALADKANSSDLATVATSGSYTDLSNKPTINNSTITIQKNGSTVDTFTTNGSAKTIDIPVPTKTSDLTNDSNFVVSSSLATVATSGDYDDLSNKPSIPTNTSDLNNDSGFVTLNDFDIPAKTSDLTNDSGFITSSDVPISTSDLINDSNFVDTSNSAVASGITSAKVTDYDTHIADTDIHVTTADKTKWNNNVTQSFVFRYSSTALVASSTNSNTLLDNTDNLKVGDKVIDRSGVLFSITAIDTQNSAFTIGTALIDLAQDSDVVHKSGNETISGSKTFSSDITLQGTTTPVIKTISNIVQDTSAYNGSVSWVIRDKDNLNNILESVLYKYSAKSIDWQLKLTGIDNGVSNTKGIRFTLDPVNNVAYFIPIGNNSTSFGNSSTKWKEVYATNYYYGSNNVEFSTKFVTTDTDQTISGKKTFSDDLIIYNNNSSQNTKNLNIISSKIQVGDTSNSDNFGIRFNAGPSYVAQILAVNDTAGTQNLQFSVRTKDSLNNFINSAIRLRVFANGISSFEPSADDSISLGSGSLKYKDVRTNKVNGVEPSSLGMPSGNASNVIDISSYIVNLDGTDNTYIAPANGWITIKASTATGISCTIPNLWNDSRIRTNAGGLKMLFPILKGQTVYMSIYATTIDMARFIPCQGNV